MRRPRHHPQTADRRSARLCAALLALAAVAALPAMAGAWILDLADSARVVADRVAVGDIVRQPVPERAANVVVYAGGLPGGRCERWRE